MSPYTIGDMALNVARSLKAANILINHKCAPYTPLLSHFQHMMFPQDYDIWLKLDIEWLCQCHAAIRLPGESSGADREQVEADKNNIPWVLIHEDELDEKFEEIRKSWDF